MNLPVDPARKITVLPESLANKIAAGEVIQRPASVVKELLENSLDAGARRIVVAIKDGGTTLIQVSDDGVGMDEEDAVTSFLRHATSKIATYEDLEEIRTFGFRGEALASIAAVARVTMKTRRQQDEAATVVHIDGGKPPRVTREGREVGTTLLVQNLFYNVPARRKFLKSDATEFRHIYDAVLRVGLSHPELSLDFISDEEPIFRLQPGVLRDRILDLFGERQLSALIDVREETTVARVHGYVGKPAFGQKGRSNQFIFLNRRFILSRTISHAVFSAYEHLLEKGRFPFFLLFLEIDPRNVDVNVHPSKLEAKFDDEAAIHRLINAMVRRVLSSGEFVPGLSLEGGAPESPGLRFTGRQHDMPTDSGGGLSSGPFVDTRTGEIISPARMSGMDLAAAVLHPGASPGDHPPSSQGIPEGTDSRGWSRSGPCFQIENTYILTPVEHGLLIVDQHVAHERVLYERAMARLSTGAKEAQQLLFPQTVELSPAEASLLGQLLPHLTGLGFDIKQFGKNTIVIDGIPSDVKTGDEERMLKEVLALYREYEHLSPLDAREALAKSFACRSAVKAGDVLTKEEMVALLEELARATMPFVCPHGRPVALRIAREELDRRFGRT